MTSGAASDGTARAGLVHLAKALLTGLWFPAVFFIGFLTCYLLPFHNPTPHNLSIAVPAPAAAEVQRGLDREVPGWFEVEAVAGGRDQLAEKVKRRDVLVAYYPAEKQPTLYVAGGNGAEITLVTKEVFATVAEAAGTKLAVIDVAPTAPKDGMGTSLFYLALALTIPAYVTVMMMLRAVGLSRAKKVTTYVVVGFIASVVAFYTAVAMDCVKDRPLSILFMFMLTQAVALTGYGLVPFVRQLFPGVAVVVFVLLSIPASGGAVPIAMVPGFFRALHPVLPIGNLIDALRSHMYFHDNHLARPLIVLGIWMVVGIVLIAAGSLLERRQIAAAEARSGERLTAVDLEHDVEDPALEMPEPSEVRPHMHRIGGSDPQLWGTVRSPQTTPIAGVRIVITDETGNRLLKTCTDDQGDYRATGLPEGPLYIVAGGPDFAPAIVRTWVRTGNLTHQDFVLAAADETGTATSMD